MIPLKREQSGVALITILLVVVMVVALAATLMAKQDRLVHEAQVFLRGEQALEFALGAEALASQMLQKDAQTNQTDSMRDVWAKPIPSYDVQDGKVSARIIEQNAKFNLNNLYHDGAVDELQLAYFRRLLKRLGLKPTLANAVLDWQDPDDNATKDGGAERDFYQSLTVGATEQKSPTLLPPNQPFVSTDELAFVYGFDEKALKKLLPLVVAQPTFSPINVNTAKPMVLAALDDRLNSKAIMNFAKARSQKKPLATVDEFLALPALKKTQKLNKLKYMLAVESRYFQSQAVVSLSGRKRYLRSDLVKYNGAISVYRRDNTPFTLLSPKARSNSSALR